MIRFIKEKDIDVLIIVSKDGDYFLPGIKPVQLLAPLLEEFQQQAKGGAQVLCFESLAEALKKFSEYQEVKTLPKDEELKAIKAEEVSSSQVFWKPYFSLGIPMMDIISKTEVFAICDGCGRYGSMKGVSIFMRKDGDTFREFQC